MNANGASKLTYWIMGALFAILMLLISGGAAAFNLRLEKVEDGNAAVKLDIAQIRWDVSLLRSDVCRLQATVDDLREEVTHHRIFRRPCP